MDAQGLDISGHRSTLRRWRSPRVRRSALAVSRRREERSDSRAVTVIWPQAPGPLTMAPASAMTRPLATIFRPPM
ncbi:hypothetical protein SMD11_7048 [Streptomyces albireticuli]|uniref:Uncharacterized protein n=1 Tax=Streptomyces albireticuli TaxID=1940 RepID=A0A1Z2LEA9_9ACTN|nr:hypothetical protein SMD11_7048 [Streptomyces albireticuli]